jgi:hypothetical protein
MSTSTVRTNEKRILTGLELAATLREKLGLPDKTRRIVIDIRHDDAVRIYYECFATEDLKDAILGVDLSAGLAIEVGKESEKPTPPTSPDGLADVTTVDDEYVTHLRTG